jgi:hypothetical protein
MSTAFAVSQFSPNQFTECARNVLGESSLPKPHAHSLYSDVAADLNQTHYSRSLFVADEIKASSADAGCLSGTATPPDR